MKLSQLTRRAQDAIDERGGMDALTQDVQEARDAARGRDSLTDKARAAAGALKQPGRDRGASGRGVKRRAGARPRR
jgi:hypothetical protein